MPHFVQRGDPSNGCSDASFTPAKVMGVLRPMKPKDSCGPDGFPSVLVKKDGQCSV